MAEVVRGAAALQQELEKTRESLKGVDENIRKLTGRDPTATRPFVGRRGVYDAAQTQPAAGSGNGEASANRDADFVNFPRRNQGTAAAAASRLSGGSGGGGGGAGLNNRRTDGSADAQEPAFKRRTVGESRLIGRLGNRHPDSQPATDRHHSDEEDEDLHRKPAVASSVVVTIHPPPDPKARQVLIEQNSDAKSRSRNKRMFGALLGTLQRFKDESKLADDREKRRQEVERKLEEKQRSERENLRRERQALFGERRRQEAQMRQIQQKIYLVQQFELWEKETRKFENFIRTKSKPCVYYLPKTIIPENQSQIEATKKYVNELVSEKRRRLEADIERLTGGGGTAAAGTEAMEEDEDHPAAASAQSSLPGRLVSRDVASDEDEGEEEEREEEGEEEEEEGEIRERGRRRGSDAIIAADDLAASRSDKEERVRESRSAAIGVAAPTSEAASELMKGERMDLGHAADAEEARGAVGDEQLPASMELSGPSLKSSVESDASKLEVSAEKQHGKSLSSSDASAERDREERVDESSCGGATA